MTHKAVIIGLSCPKVEIASRGLKNQSLIREVKKKIDKGDVSNFSDHSFNLNEYAILVQILYA